MHSTITHNELNPTLHSETPSTSTQGIFASPSSKLSRQTSNATCPHPPCHILATTRPRLSNRITERILSPDVSPTTPTSPAISTVPIAILDATPEVTTQRTLTERRRTDSFFGNLSFRFAIFSRRKRSLKLESPSSRKASTSSGTARICESMSPTTVIVPSPDARPRVNLQTNVLGESEECFPFLNLISNLSSIQDKDPSSEYYNITPLPSVELRPHPGTLVDVSPTSEAYPDTPRAFSLRPGSPSSTSSEPSSVSSSGDYQSAARDYHDFLRDINSTAKSGEMLSRTYFYNSSFRTIGKDTIYASSSDKNHLENIDYKEQKAERRAQSLEVQAQLLREGSCANSSLNSTGHGIESRKGSAQSRRCSEDSTELVLSHIRSSFEARKNSGAKKPSYNVFKDEVEKGFLDGTL